MELMVRTRPSLMPLGPFHSVIRVNRTRKGSMKDMHIVAIYGRGRSSHRKLE